MDSVAVAINFSGQLAGVNFLARDIVQVSKGKKFTEKQKEHVLEYLKREGIKNFKGHRFKRTETLDKEITVDTYYFPVHLAIMYKNSDILALFYEKMKDDEEYTKEILNLEIESNLDKVKQYMIKIKYFYMYLN